MAGNKVTQYLKEILCLDDSVIKNFLDQKIDESNIRKLSSQQLVFLGVKAMGDQIKLLEHFKVQEQRSHDQEKVEKLRDLLRERKRKNPKSNAFPSSEKEKKQKRDIRFEFGWKHWNCKTKKYTYKKQDQGGGNRELYISRTSSLIDCLDIAVNIFFPQGENDVGKAHEMDFLLANFQGKAVGPLLKTSETFADFTAELYKRSFGLAKPRLYLFSKPKQSVVMAEESDDEDLNSQVYKGNFPTQCDNGYDDDDDFDTLDEAPTKTSLSRNGPKLQWDDEVDDILSEQTFTRNKTTASCSRYIHTLQVNDDFNGSNDDIMITEIKETTAEDASSLIGTQEERQRIFEDIQQQIQESLSIDKEKAAKKEQEKKEEEELDTIQKRREGRVLPEPDIGVTIRVMHPSLGVISRRFDKSCSMQAVYDWAGSLHKKPKYFSLLCTFPSHTIYPDELVVNYNFSLLMVREENQPLPLSYDDNVVIINNGDLASDHDDTFEMPAVLLKDDIPLYEDEKKIAHNFEKLNEKRLKLLANITSTEHISVNKETIVEDMLKIYKDATLVEKMLDIDLKSSTDTAIGDGVAREMFSLFWEKFLINCGECNQVALPVGPNTDSYTSVGRILYHGFVLTGFFPTRISRACMYKALFDVVSEDCIIESFLESLPQKQKELLRQAVRGDNSEEFPRDDICDILADYGNTRLPDYRNINSIVLEIGTVEFVSKPYLCIMTMKQGMGSFWDGVSQGEMDSLYETCKPTPKRIIEALLIDPQGKKEEKISRWLRLYLKECDERGLRRFLWFCTGTDILVPGRRIKVSFEFMPEVLQRPKAKTCFCVLTLPSSYSSYANLQSNLAMYLNNLDSWDMCDD